MFPQDEQAAFVTRVQLLNNLHRHADAEQLAREYIAAYPDRAEGYLHLAIAASFQEGAEQRALIAVRRAIALAPAWSDTYFTLARLLMQVKQPKPAFQAMQEALRLEPHQPLYLAQLGRMHLQMRKNKEALDAALQGLQVDPVDLGCANVQAAALINLGRKQEASEVLTRVLSMDPLDASAHHNTGRTLLAAGEVDLARVHFVEALRQTPKWDPPRKGLLEALKSRNWLYNTGTRAVSVLVRRWKITLPGLVILGVLMAWLYAVRQPEYTWSYLAMIAFIPIVVVYGLMILFGLYSRLLEVMLRFDPYGRMVMSKEEIHKINLLMAFAGAAVPSALLGIALGQCIFGVLIWSMLVIFIQIGVGLREKYKS